MQSKPTEAEIGVDEEGWRNVKLQARLRTAAYPATGAQETVAARTEPDRGAGNGGGASGVDELIRYIDESLADADGREINPSNYTHDDACQLNDGFVQLFGSLENLRAMLEKLHPQPSPARPGPVEVNERDLDYIREKLRGAASDCNVRLEPDQVRYITKAVLDAHKMAMRRSQPARPAPLREAIAARIRCCDLKQGHEYLADSLMLADAVLDEMQNSVRPEAVEMSDEDAQRAMADHMKLFTQHDRETQAQWAWSGLKAARFRIVKDADHA